MGCCGSKDDYEDDDDGFYGPVPGGGPSRKNLNHASKNLPKLIQRLRDAKTSEARIDALSNFLPAPPSSLSRPSSSENVSVYDSSSSMEPITPGRTPRDKVHISSEQVIQIMSCFSGKEERYQALSIARHRILDMHKAFIILNHTHDDWERASFRRILAEEALTRMHLDFSFLRTKYKAAHEYHPPAPQLKNNAPLDSAGNSESSLTVTTRQDVLLDSVVHSDPKPNKSKGNGELGKALLA